MCMKDEVIVWGTEVASIQFLLTHREIAIKYFIDGRKTIKFFDGKRCYVPEEANILPKRDYIVVATSETVYWEIKNYLEERGFKEFDDFCYYELFNKKIAIIYGNCHTFPVKQGLQLSEQFNSQYGFYPLHEIQDINNNKLKDLESIAFERCDLFLHQSVRENNIYGNQYASKEMLARLKEKCIQISIPNLYGLPKFLYPQCDTNLETKRIEGKNFFPFRDRYIENLWNAGKDEYAIKKYIEEDTVVNINSINEGFAQFLKKLKTEKKSGMLKLLNGLGATISNTTFSMILIILPIL